MANETLQSISQDADEWLRYRARLKTRMDYEHDVAASLRMGREKGLKEGIKKMEPLIAEKEAQLAEKDAALAAKDAQIAEMSTQLAQLLARVNALEEKA